MKYVAICISMPRKSTRLYKPVIRIDKRFCQKCCSHLGSDKMCECKINDYVKNGLCVIWCVGCGSAPGQVCTCQPYYP